MANYSQRDSRHRGLLINDRGWITCFLEKPEPDEVFSNLVNTGVYVMEPNVLKWFPPQTICDFGYHIFPWLIDNNKRGWISP